MREPPVIRGFSPSARWALWRLWAARTGHGVRPERGPQRVATGTVLLALGGDVQNVLHADAAVTTGCPIGRG
ncbi:MAG TPA: hypothetical protein PK781_00015 [Terrimesophilobacter sp.]|nr:hypothetical protein [Terrimesophilobacter sp.]HRP98827.1 hypothetical protein [Terrimesophilobacter sp.]